MSLRSVTVLRAGNIAALNTAIAAAIANGADEVGPVTHEGGSYLCSVATHAKQTVYSADGAIDPTCGTAVLTKGSAAAMTLAAPTVAQNGLRLRIISSSAFAHVVTATNLLEDGVTGGAKDTATFAAFKGAGLDLEAYAGTWHIVGKNVVTVAAA
jgi:hypothetical protein